VKRYKTLLSSAPAQSILNAQAFRYTSSVDTDIRATFARIRRERAKAVVIVNIAGRARCLARAGDTSPTGRSVQSTAR